MKPAGDLLCLVVSRAEILSGDISTALSKLNSLLQTPEIAKAHMERVDIAFNGYDDDTRELNEIDEVRDFVQKLDSEFPFWLFFLSKHMPGLQCVILCHLLPFLTDEGKAKHHPRQLGELLNKRWLPAMNKIAQFVRLSEREIEEMTDRFFIYIQTYRLPSPDRQ